MVRGGEKPIYVILMQIIGPALIIAMVASLVFFLIEVLYRGPHNLRLYWVLGLFTCASVLVSRISIEEGRERAMLFGMALALATFIASLRLVEFAYVGAAFLGPVVITVLIAVVMWTSSKLTWDCTVVDRSRDVSAMGMMELIRRRMTQSRNDEEEVAADADQSAQSSKADAWLKFLVGGEKSNTPGIWVFYFAVLAFPLFGFGQWFVLEDSQSWVYVLFAVYLGASLGLLMTTSLLGLERYLSKRNVHVPNPIARNWLVVGGVFALIVVIAVMLVPRSTSGGSLSHVSGLLKSPFRAASKWAAGKDGQEEQENAKGRKVGDDGEKEDRDGADKGGGKSKGNEGDSESKKSGSNSKTGKSADSNQKSRQGKGNRAERNDNRDDQQEPKGRDDRSDSKGERQKTDQTNRQRAAKNPDKNNNRQDANRRQPRQQQRRAEPPQQQAGAQKTQSALNNLMKQLATVTRWLGYLLGVIALGFLLWLFRDDLARIWASFFAKKKADTADPAPTTNREPRKPERPFSSFRNPFASGQAKSMTPDQLVHYSLAALEALAREFGMQRDEDATVAEFARQIHTIDGKLGEQAGGFAHLYGQCAFGSEPIGRNEIEPLVDLWRQMMATVARRNAPVPA